MKLPANHGVWLRSVVTGYYQYHAVPGNIDQLRIFKRRVNRLWRKVLVRRSQRARKKWEKFAPIFDSWIPPPRVLHPYPDWHRLKMYEESWLLRSQHYPTQNDRVSE
ncbi:MAG: hypothetical protein WCA10_04455 [Terracidiphilus sp.]